MTRKSVNSIVNPSWVSPQPCSWLLRCRPGQRGRIYDIMYRLLLKKLNMVLHIYFWPKLYNYYDILEQYVKKQSWISRTIFAVYVSFSGSTTSSFLDSVNHESCSKFQGHKIGGDAMVKYSFSSRNLSRYDETTHFASYNLLHHQLSFITNWVKCYVVSTSIAPCSNRYIPNIFPICNVHVIKLQAFIWKATYLWNFERLW